MDYFEKVKHDIPMLSLSNAADESEFKDYYVRTTKAVSLSDIELFAEPKFDGLAISITYIDGKFDKAVTRKVAREVAKSARHTGAARKKSRLDLNAFKA